MSRWSGQILSTEMLAKVYGFTDSDGSQPDAWLYLVEVQKADKTADVTGYPEKLGGMGDSVDVRAAHETELDQLYVSARARGSGVAAILIADAELRLRDAGVRTAWLACAIGNDRAARFYEKHRWHRAGIMVNRLETIRGEYLLEVWRYEKPL